jgi:hypothetical protein
MHNRFGSLGRGLRSSLFDETRVGCLSETRFFLCCQSLIKYDNAESNECGLFGGGVKQAGLYPVWMDDLGQPVDSINFHKSY